MKNKIKENSKVLLRMLIGYSLYFISFLFPRKKQRWVFGSGSGFSDNAKYLFLDVVENHKNIDAVWISKNKNIINELKHKGLSAYYMYSLKGIKYLLTANIYCVANYLSFSKDISLPLWTKGRAKYVQLWHGVGVKKVLFTRDNYLADDMIKHPIKKYTWLIPTNYNRLIKPDLFLSTSKVMTEHFIKCFRLNRDVVVEAHYPRFQVFDDTFKTKYMTMYADEGINRLFNNFENYNKVYVYMPTFREENLNYLRDAGINYSKLNEMMKKENSLFVFKLHPWSKVSLPSKSQELKNILFLDSTIDIYPLLPQADVLITDYSSIYYDYFLMKDKYTIFFDFDRDEYINERDFAFDYDEYTNGVKVKTFEALLECLSTQSYKEIDRNKDRELKEFFWGKLEDKVNLIEAIKGLEH